MKSGFFAPRSSHGAAWEIRRARPGSTLQVPISDFLGARSRLRIFSPACILMLLMRRPSVRFMSAVVLPPARFGVVCATGLECRGRMRVSGGER